MMITYRCICSCIGEMRVEGKHSRTSLWGLIDSFGHDHPTLFPRLAPNRDPAFFSDPGQPCTCYACHVHQPPGSRPSGRGIDLRILCHFAPSDCRTSINSHHFRRTWGITLPPWYASLAHHRTYRTRTRVGRGTCSHSIWFYTRSRLCHGGYRNSPAPPDGRCYQHLVARCVIEGRCIFDRL